MNEDTYSRESLGGLGLYRILWRDTVSYIKNRHKTLVAYKTLYDNKGQIQFVNLGTPPVPFSIAQNEEGAFYVKTGDAKDYFPVHLDKPIIPA